jgi:uncharacterized membrane protein
MREFMVVPRMMHTELSPKKSFIISSLFFAIIAFIAATILTVEKLELLKNPEYVPSCSISPFLSCGPIMLSPQASAFFGFPNSIIGMLGFAIVIFILGSSLFLKLPRWYWLAYTVGVILSFIFIIWLMVQSLVVISALCIYCMITWASVIPLTWLAIGNITAGTKFKFFDEYKPLLMTLSYIGILTAIFFHFQDYWLSFLN